MAKKITQEQIEQMKALYAQIGTYSGVAKQMGISASTVSRYLKENAAVKSYSEVVLTPKPIEEISLESVINFSFLSEEEQASYENWLKEFGK